MRALTTVIGTLLEAWSEVRVHRGRVVLSLVGVTVAVASLTAVTGFGSLSEAAVQATSERWAGRPATFSMSVTADEPTVVDPSEAAAAFRAAVDRYGIEQASVVQDEQRRVQFPDGVREVGTHLVDRAWGAIHPNEFTTGRWFTVADEQLLAPAIVVNGPFWDALGDPDLALHPVVDIAPTTGARAESTAQLVGVIDTGTFDPEPKMWMLAPDAPATVSSPADDSSGGPTFEMWIPAHGANALSARVRSDVRQALGDGAQVEMQRTDQTGPDGTESLTVMITAVSVLVLLLGAVGLLGVSLVSVRQRIRDIGIRRGVGATAPRIFVAVMLENVVGTAVAGAVGVMAAALVMGLPVVRESLTLGLPVTLPPFPVRAAVIGMACSVGVGALSGLVPAFVAVRVRVVDAIRY
ncbi:ABC transporter permease [Curtobacterium sp. RRHDQ10]|uniref:ABC transporter permease n=1 Tax=Curtobacterium phyllosphaerae TaxID=3413379 RepID=UPI003BF0FBD1